MNLANSVTLLRILLTGVFMFFLFAHSFSAKIAALVTFLLASLTDAVDGLLAKRLNQITDFGKLMDPIADKVLILSAFIAFVEMELVPAWMVVIIIFREAVITGLRIMALSKGKVIPADTGGKHKTVSQMLSIIAIITFLVFREGGAAVFGFWDGPFETVYAAAIYWMMSLTVVLTLASGIAYLVKNKEVYRSHEKTD